jgi:uncharacterized circularly permuted ATP-grasp superfamily protein
MTDITEAIAHYNALLERHGNGISEIYRNFFQTCEKNKLAFGGRSMYNFLRPNFISKDQYRTIQVVCKTLRNAVTKFKNAALNDPAMMAQAGIVAREKELVDIDPGYDRLSITARWDSFLDGDVLKFVELNAECPAGIAYSDVAAKVYDTLPFVKEFKKMYSVEKFQIRKTLLDELLLTYRLYRGHKRNKKPTIAIVDWKEVPTYTEFQLFDEFFKSQGLKSVIADPRDLVYKDNRLQVHGTEIDLVYKRILTNDCVEKPDETKALVDAYRHHDVCMINPFRAKIVHKKSIFSVLTHEKNAHLFNKAEHAAISEHIPWTRVIENEHTFRNAQKIDLVEYISSHKDDLVIKPNDEYGGKGVCLGKETTQENWNSVIQEALGGDLYVVQELVGIPRVAFPIVENDQLKYVDMVVDMDPYAFGPRVEGILTRLSSSSLANVTAGGGTTPTFVIERIQAKKSKIVVKKVSKSGPARKIMKKKTKRTRVSKKKR